MVVFLAIKIQAKFHKSTSLFKLFREKEKKR